MQDTTDLERRIRQLEHQIAVLERRNTTLSRYGWFYMPTGVLMIVLSFLPLYEDVQVTEDYVRTWSQWSLWDYVLLNRFPPAVLGLLLLGAFVVLSFVATFAPHDFAWPACLAFVAALLALMLIAKPGTGSPPPELAPTSKGGLALILGCFGLGVAHAIHASRKQRPQPSLATSGLRI